MSRKSRVSTIYNLDKIKRVEKKIEHLLEDRKKLVCEEDRVSTDARLDACQQFAKEAQTREEKMSSECKSEFLKKWVKYGPEIGSILNEFVIFIMKSLLMLD